MEWVPCGRGFKNKKLSFLWPNINILFMHFLVCLSGVLFLLYRVLVRKRWITSNIYSGQMFYPF
ncbi:protein of unknown function [Xenorhabdus poinarii G6]|uniref:Uncharacterized protein n=1 Tax=Xenorhabdus poinarii G6 TaxID=1354304 RepID=A0A068R5V1_9GAMM|nr:protein of unknown function [Xenorhabdus poinarii G6]